MQKRTPNPTNNCSGSTYTTGTTAPSKSHSGIIALLLCLVIFLCGIITVLGITNVRLFQALDSLEDREEVPISFSHSQARASQPQICSEDPQEHAVGGAVPFRDLEGNTQVLSAPLGLEGESVPKVYQLYFRLPQGLYIQTVDPASHAALVGIEAGDIVTCINGIAITSPAELQQALSECLPGDTISLTIYRNSQQFMVEIVVQPCY